MYDHRNKAHDATLSFEGDAPTGSATSTINNIVKTNNMSALKFQGDFPSSGEFKLLFDLTGKENYIEEILAESPYTSGLSYIFVETKINGTYQACGQID